MKTTVRLTRDRMEREVMTDARLDALAERFVSGQVRELLGIRFEHYINNPDEFDWVVAGLKDGSLALQRRCDEKALSVVEVRQSPVAYGLILIPLGRN